MLSVKQRLLMTTQNNIKLYYAQYSLRPDEPNTIVDFITTRLHNWFVYSLTEPFLIKCVSPRHARAQFTSCVGWSILHAIPIALDLLASVELVRSSVRDQSHPCWARQNQYRYYIVNNLSNHFHSIIIIIIIILLVLLSHSCFSE